MADVNDDPHNSFTDQSYGIGQNADGTFNVFPKAELARKVAERDSQDEAIAHAMKQSEEGFPPSLDEEQIEDFADIEG